MKLKNAVLNFLFQQQCVFCLGVTTAPFCLCVDCQRSLPWLKNKCRLCAEKVAVSEPVCGRCLDKPPIYQHLVVPFAYENSIMQFITGLKFHEQLINAKILAYLLSQYVIATSGSENLPELILPIPLSSQRFKERGFNQALEIAKYCSVLLTIPFIRHGIKRVKATAAQSGLSLAERKKNLAQAFQIDIDLSNRHVAVIDDVVTTGQTLQAFCSVLKKAKVKRIDVWAVAKTLKKIP